MHTLSVRRVGNSLGMILPAEVAGALRVEAGDTLYLTEAPDGFRITPYDPEFARSMTLAQGLLRRYRNALRELGE
jgi:putative addiction module antidote